MTYNPQIIRSLAENSRYHELFRSLQVNQVPSFLLSFRLAHYLTNMKK